ncbi:glycine--tRNA ligase [Candidatus Woesebacteria bacterium RIFCSPLOWO2_01_FULL_39_23]|uniref:glycine--tRNA ligase n=1 Tax=Candidatus Woesebacteria bacterium RIFCSPHIGHO2_01_FULL_40_22 TaxID=1802499 RepID=A0A1F7YLX3_9BACT|nr:MAG: glycine--tRNA ligase [Candidatus Woesebacteria bacterium RBG_16_40_11]OGM27525.1 MAG: glycine--tRNA ligase [Candidatus Woesebacteria bacterium RIFCSPHIGHO2_01_FULL_40_22]OGM36117.1 MAG: glycine--tRNA ligase [Candidatus Woesebacteria bacterium RIFCSPHIGHO2_12_FULL_38_9]OGM62699.1 MAG: glycine--tRNA ligase [Candidatus Woesebacteria bacterium RIFCSPLOWO2_01_FULL_39_23]
MDLMEKITSLCKRRGFIFPGSEIYGGLANTYDYGPLGVELLRNIKNLWWNYFITTRGDIYGLDTNILMSPKVWEASGHVAHFAEVMIDCKDCQFRARGDYLVEEFYAGKDEKRSVEGYSAEEIEKIVNEERIPCPNCHKFNWTKPRMFNNLFETHIGIVSGEKSLAYLRGEIAQGMFVNFKNVLDSISPRLPFGLAQSGSAFRNEITKGKLTFRTLQFNLSEFEYFFDPESQKWEDVYDFWKGEIWNFATQVLGLDDKKLRWREHTDKERAHYSKKTEDLDFEYPWGFKEMFAIAYRTDFDLKNHMEKSGVDLRYTDPATNNKFIPHVIEPTFGMDRPLLALLLNGYKEDHDKKRVVIKIKPQLAPYKIAVFPLLANKSDLVSKARGVYASLLELFSVAWDERGNIGKRYFSQDEIGTPWCVTIDFQTLDDNSVTVRDRDTTKQERVSVDKLENYFENRLKS